MNGAWRAYGAEFVGTAWMVAVGTGSVALGGSLLVISLSFGLAVTLAILALRGVSGAHINPAVSTGFVLTGHLPRERWLGYVLAQATGGLLGSGVVHAVIGPDELAPTVFAEGLSTLSAVGIEVGITAALMASILAVVAWRDDSTPTVAVVVGAVVALLAFFFGPLTGASMNPARTLGPNLLSGAGGLMVYTLATVVGAVLAAAVVRWKGSAVP